MISADTEARARQLKNSPALDESLRELATFVAADVIAQRAFDEGNHGPVASFEIEERVGDMVNIRRWTFK